jgi:hypothetical protein
MVRSRLTNIIDSHVMWIVGGDQQEYVDYLKVIHLILFRVLTFLLLCLFINFMLFFSLVFLIHTLFYFESCC